MSAKAHEGLKKTVTKLTRIDESTDLRNVDDDEIRLPESAGYHRQLIFFYFIKILIFDELKSKNRPRHRRSEFIWRKFFTSNFLF